MAARGSDGRLAIPCRLGWVPKLPGWRKPRLSSSLKFLGISAAIVAGLALASPIAAAEDNQSPGSNMGSGMMEHGGMMNMMQQMSQMMESCNTIMQRTSDPGKSIEQPPKNMPMHPEKKR